MLRDGVFGQRITVSDDFIDSFALEPDDGYLYFNKNGRLPMFKTDEIPWSMLRSMFGSYKKLRQLLGMSDYQLTQLRNGKKRPSKYMLRLIIMYLPLCRVPLSINEMKFRHAMAVEFYSSAWMRGIPLRN